MKGLRYSLAAVIVVALTNKGVSGDVPTNEVMRVTLDLSDGSRVIGIPAVPSIPIRTAFAKMDIPLRQIQQVVIGGDHETVEVETTNGDHLTGVLSLGPVELTTLFGKVSVGIEHIRGVQVRLNGSGDLPAKLKECLVLHFSFDKDESGPCTDASGKGNDGKVQGSTWVRQGHHGGAMKFDGVDDQIYVADSASLDMTSLTLAAWICPDDLLKGNNMIMEKRPHDGCWELMHFDSGRLLVRGSSPQTDPSERGTIEAGKWMHVVATISGSEGQIYVDGNKVKTTPVAPVRVTSGEVLIGAGRCWSPADDQFKGVLDDVMIFGRALSASEVQQLYNSQK